MWTTWNKSFTWKHALMIKEHSRFNFKPKRLLKSIGLGLGFRSVDICRLDFSQRYHPTLGGGKLWEPGSWPYLAVVDKTIPTKIHEWLKSQHSHFKFNSVFYPFEVNKTSSGITEEMGIASLVPRAFRRPEQGGREKTGLFPPAPL